MKPHPAQRFIAPSTIQRGVPLKKLMGRKLVALIAESLEVVVPGFDVCEAWLHELDAADEAKAENRRWIIRHAVRHPAKKENHRALKIRDDLQRRRDSH